MEIRENDKFCIFAPLNPKIDKYQSDRLFSEILSEDRNIAIDLVYAQDCTFDFLEKIKEVSLNKNVGIFNIPSDLFTLFNIMDIDKFAKLFVSEQDFLEDSRQIINRKFILV